MEDESAGPVTGRNPAACADADPQEAHVEVPTTGTEDFEMIEKPSGNLLIDYLLWILQLIKTIPASIMSYLYAPTSQTVSSAVGILGVSEVDDCEWLENLLRSSEIGDLVTDIKTFGVSEEGLRGLDCSLACLVTVQPGGSRDYQRDHLDLAEGKDSPLPWEVRIAISGDSEEVGSPGSRRCEEETPRAGSRLVIFTREEMKLHKEDPEILQRTTEKLQAMRGVMAAGLESWIPLLQNILGPWKHKVGIFSRSCEEDYEWLEARLKSALFEGVVESTHPYYITNNGGPRFRERVSQCTFAILYHTKNRGRINVTDVKDSLYDRELEYLHSHLGKQNVFVVIDDLQESNPDEKNRILANQPSIGKMAADLLLLHRHEKSFWAKIQTIKESTKGVAGAAETKMADSPA